jgi:hypothetical protein
VDPQLQTALLTAIGTVLVGLLSYLGVRFTQRQVSKAAKRTAEIEQEKVDAAAYQEARAIWDDLIKDMREQIADQRSQLTELRGETGDLRKRLAELEEKRTAETGELRRRLADVETKRAGDRRAIHQLTVYARSLLSVLKNHGITPPVPPEGLDLDGDDDPPHEGAT